MTDQFTITESDGVMLPAGLTSMALRALLPWPLRLDSSLTGNAVTPAGMVTTLPGGGTTRSSRDDRI